METDMTIQEARSSIAREIVVLPAPDGEESTNINPRRWILKSSSKTLLHVLRLFPKLIYHRFHFQPYPCQLFAGRF
jgi:hypothetical protein